MNVKTAHTTTPEIMGTYGCRTFNTAGALCQPRCDVCNLTVKVDDGEQWVMLSAGVLHEFPAVVCVPCVRARLGAPTDDGDRSARAALAVRVAERTTALCAVRKARIAELEAEMAEQRAAYRALSAELVDALAATDAHANGGE